MIPPWTEEGLLPAGVHAVGWGEVRNRFGWNSRRASLLLGILAALDTLDEAGCTQLWLDGSFVTDKEMPDDWDGCWDWHGVNATIIDPVLLRMTRMGRRMIKSKYLGDVVIAGVERGSGLQFVDFFQQTRDGSSKGIVLLNPQEAR